VGLSEQYDQTNVAMAKNKPNDGNQSQNNQDDSLKREWGSADPSLTEANQTTQDSNSSLGNHDQFNDDNDNFVPTNPNRHNGRVRTRAS
jgi:hypothetical protein